MPEIKDKQCNLQVLFYLQYYTCLGLQSRFVYPDTSWPQGSNQGFVVEWRDTVYDNIRELGCFNKNVGYTNRIMSTCDARSWCWCVW